MIGATVLAIDRRILDAEKEIDRLMELTHHLDDLPGAAADRERDRILQQVWRLEDEMADTPAQTLAGAAAKLRRVLDPELGIDGEESELAALRDVLGSRAASAVKPSEDFPARASAMASRGKSAIVAV